MKKALKILGIALGVVVLIAAIAGIYFNSQGIPTYETQDPEITLTADSAQLARGEYLVNLSCAFCHRGENNTLSGRFLEENDFGKVYAPNITSHPDAKLGQYTDGELAYLLRTGIRRDGKLALPMMPRWNRIGEEDLQAIIAYLRSGPRIMEPSDKVQPESELSLMGKVLMNLAVKPIPYPETAVVAPPRSEPVAYGRYLSTAVVHCYHCHSANFATADDLVPEHSEGFFGGGNLVHNFYKEGDWVLSSNLTPHAEHGLGQWTGTDFATAVRTGKGLDGQTLSTAMPRFTSMADEDVNAIWAYLQTVPALDNQVLRAQQ